MIVKPCLLIQLFTECVTPGRAICGGPCTNFYSGGCHLWWIATDGNVTLVVVTGQVSGGLSDQVRLTRGQVWDDEACTHSKQAPSSRCAQRTTALQRCQTLNGSELLELYSALC